MHETDYQRARRQSSEVKKHGITGSTPEDAAKRIKGHSEAKTKALRAKKEHPTPKYTGKKGEYSKTQQGNFMKVHPLDRI